MSKLQKKALMACPNYWWAPSQVGSHHLARCLVKMGWQVAFISDPISPLHACFGRRGDIEERFAIYAAGGKTDLQGQLWTYVPGALLTPHNQPILNSHAVAQHWHRWTMPNIIDKVKEQGYGEVDLLYLDSVCQAFWLDRLSYRRSVFRMADRTEGYPKYSEALRLQERNIVQSVDLVVYTAANLKEYVQVMHPKQSMHVPNGINLELFLSSDRQLPEEYRTIPAPRAVYVGAIDQRLDYHLLEMLAKAIPQLSIVLVGPVQVSISRFDQLSNVYFLGARPHTTVPNYLRFAQVGIIPFDVIGQARLVQHIHSLKLYEYLACNLPVVAMEWAELKGIDSPAILCDDRESYIQAIIDVLNHPPQTDDYQQFVKNKDWRTRAETILNAVAA